MPVSPTPVDLHRLTRSDDVVVDERPHVHLLLHPPGSRRRRRREERIGRAARAVWPVGPVA